MVGVKHCSVLLSLLFIHSKHVSGRNWYEENEIIPNKKSLPSDCRNERFVTEGGNLVAMSWHLHYVYNTNGFYAFCTSFEEEFSQYFDPTEGTPCPFGPNYGSNTYPYICNLESCSNFLKEGNLAGGPWNDPQRAFFVPNNLIEETWKWAKDHKFETDLFRHPNTGCMYDDHLIRGVWDLSSGIEHTINPLEFPCNNAGTGCLKSDGPRPTSCECPMPVSSDAPEDSCENCILEYDPPTEPLVFTCTPSPIRVNYEHALFYSGEVSCGNVFLECDIGGGIDLSPKVSFPELPVEDMSYYVVMMVDPDADLPDNGSWRKDEEILTPGDLAPVRHWVVGNVNSEILRTGFNEATVGIDIVQPFKGPSPPYGSHRYGIFLFRQFEGQRVEWEPLRIKWEMENDIFKWNYQQFIFDYTLNLVASNWHITQHAEPRT